MQICAISFRPEIQTTESMYCFRFPLHLTNGLFRKSIPDNFNELLSIFIELQQQWHVK